MGIFDNDYEEEIESYQLGNNLIEECKIPTNTYLKNSSKALELISKIIGINIKNNRKDKKIEELEKLLEKDFLKILLNTSISNKIKIQDQLLKLTKKLYEEQEYNILKNKIIIGVGGKFSSGKSSFINCLLDMENALPENQTPTTSIPTYLLRDEKEYIDIFTKDNQRIPIEESEMQALTHEFFKKYKIGFSSFVESIIISNSELPYRNFAFLDTPGYSKPENFRTKESETDKEKAYEQLKKVNYLIWIVDQNSGDINETDINFIRQLKVVNKILIILNKVDKITKEAVEKILNQINKTVKNRELNVYDVIPFSSSDERIKKENFFKIQQFFDFINNENTIKTDDIFEQISEIRKSIEIDINSQIKEKENERNRISEIIFKSNDIFEIKTLVEIYGEIMEETRELKKHKSFFEGRIVEIEKNLNEYFGGNNGKSI